MNISEVVLDTQHRLTPPDNQLNGLYEMRMNEFCINKLNRPSILSNDFLSVNFDVTRPKSSISPINLSSATDSASALAYSHISDPIERNQNDSCLHSTSTNNASYSASPYISKIIQPHLLPVSNLNQHDSGYYNSSILTSSPFVLTNKSAFKNPPYKNRLLGQNFSDNTKKSIRFQSTPNKSVNFGLHEPFITNQSSIDNSQSQTSFTSAVKTTTTTTMTTTTTRILSTCNKVNFHSIMDLATSSSCSSEDSKLTENNFSDIVSSNMDNNQLQTSTQVNSSLSFNEKLKLMSEEITNKENNHEFSISKTKRKPRTQITKQQKEILEYAYKMKSYPDSNEVEYLCNLLGFEENVIRIWFQNKRARAKLRN